MSQDESFNSDAQRVAGNHNSVEVQGTSDKAASNPLTIGGDVANGGTRSKIHKKRSRDCISAEGGDSGPRKYHMHDPVYRIMHMTPRSDVLEVVKCRFGSEECQRAATYFDSSYTRNPLRYLRLQIGCDRATGFSLFFPRLQHHRATLRLLDLSRNCLDEEDVATLVNLLNLRNDDKCESLSVLEVLDLSYNRRIGNSGGVMLLGALHGNDHIRAVVLKGISLTDAGATSIASLLQQRPKPRTCVGECMHSCEALHNGHAAGGSMFFLNLNENLIGSKGIHALGKGIPSYVSLTACKQHPLTSRNRSLASTL